MHATAFMSFFRRTLGNTTVSGRVRSLGASICSPPAHFDLLFPWVYWLGGVLRFKHQINPFLL